MGLLRINHVQIAIPRGAEAQARRFYGEVLGLREVSKPASMAVRGGAWFELGPVQVHLGADANFRPAQKAHVAFDVEQLDVLAEKCRAAGHAPRFDDEMPGRRRCFIDDPFGNRVELVEAKE